MGNEKQRLRVKKEWERDREKERGSKAIEIFPAN